VSWLFRFYGSTLGKKVVMAVSGLILFGFIIGHLAGNLQVFLGRHKLDAYSAFLKSSQAMLWGARLTLLASVGLHILASIQLTLQNRAARPVGYRSGAGVASKYAARTMIWSGPIVALFVLYHLAHFTWGTVHPSDPFDGTRVYDNVVRGFQVWPVSFFYIAAILALGLHLSHGIWSMFQSVGLTHPRYDVPLKAGAVLISAAIVAGYVVIPIAVIVGAVR
jgi:succinate dehydrogenase / fumarate reductase cytochrome b subunit